MSRAPLCAAVELEFRLRLQLPAKEILVSTSALNEAIYQNTPGNDQVTGLGLWWDTSAASTPQTSAPSGWSGLTGWAQVYQEAGASVSPNNATDTVQVQDFTTYVHLTNGTWVEVQSQAQNGIGGGHYVADFSTDANTPLKMQTLSDGSVSMDAPPSGYNDHFWPGLRGTFTPGTVDGVFVEVNMKTNDPNANLVAQLGADWWRDATAQWAGTYVNNDAVGIDNWTKLTTQWQTLYFTDLSAQQLEADPPPGLEPDSTTSTTPTTPTVQPAVTQVSASPGTGVEHAGDTVTLTVGFNEAVNVTGTPTLSLNDGNVATYVSGSGTSALTFKTTVASTDTTTSALAITGVNLPSGASIKDAGGLAADLSGAVKTFTGLQVDPTSVTKPVLTIADNTLWVAGRGGTVDLGVNVTTPDPNDLVTVNITGLPKYETITDKLDGQTFGGNNITLTAAQVDSGLVLQSNYRGGGHPVATLTLTANAKDPVTGAVTSAAPQTIAVTDPRPAASTTATSSQTTTVTDPASSTSTSSGLAAGQSTDHVSGTVVTTVPKPITVADPASAAGKSTTSLASQSFALLNQYLASNTGRVDPGQIIAAVSNGTGFGQASFLTKPQH
jgi:hypothetical protein